MYAIDYYAVDIPNHANKQSTMSFNNYGRVNEEYKKSKDRVYLQKKSFYSQGPNIVKSINFHYFSENLVRVSLNRLIGYISS